MIKGSLCALLAMTMVGSSVAVLGMLRDFPIYAGQAFRFALAAVLLLIILRLRRRRESTGNIVTVRQWQRIGLLAAIGMVGFNLFVFAAEEDTDPALVGVIVGAAPIVIALITPLMARRAPSSRIVIAGVVVATGAALAQGLGASGGSTKGILFSVAALASEVVFALVAAPILGDLGAWRVSTYACLLAVPLCLLGMLITGEYALPNGEQLLALLWLGVVVTACAYVLWFSAVGTIGPERAGLFTAVVPISAVSVTAILGTGDPTWGHATGAIVVFAGLLVGLTAGRDDAAPKAYSVATSRTGEEDSQNLRT